VCGNSCVVSAEPVSRAPCGPKEKVFHNWVWEESIEGIPNLPAGTKQ
jgi:hypothetical protein